MMQLKIIEHDGQCRGRPPTRGDTRDSWQLAVSSRQFYSTADRRPQTADHRPQSNPRDWIDHTCSVGPCIARDRHKHRLKSREDLPENGGTGEICLKVKGER